MSAERIEITGNIVVQHPVKQDHWDKVEALIGQKAAAEQARYNERRLLFLNNWPAILEDS